MLLNLTGQCGQMLPAAFPFQSHSSSARLQDFSARLQDSACARGSSDGQWDQVISAALQFKCMFLADSSTFLEDGGLALSGLFRLPEQKRDSTHVEQSFVLLTPHHLRSSVPNSKCEHQQCVLQS